MTGSPEVLRGGASVPLVGRDQQLALIAGAWAKARAGTALTVAISGEPGIGKSRLIAEAARRFQQDGGARVVRGHALEAQGLPPYFPLRGPFGAMLEALEEAEQPADDIRQVLAAAGIARAGPDAPPLAVLAPDAERLRLFDAVAELCIRVARDQPLLIILDDMQWAAPVVWDVVAYLVRAVADAPLLMLFGLREEVFREEGTAASAALAEFTRLRLLVYVPVTPLSVAEVGALAAHMLGAAVSPPLAALLTGRSGGNPFFVEEMLIALSERDALVRRDSTWDLRHDSDALQKGLLPMTLELAIGARLEGLPADTRAALQAASVLGRSMTSRVLAGVLGVERDETERMLAPAIAAGIIDVSGDGGWTFRHDTIRETVYARAAGERRRLHVAAAEVIGR